MSFQVTIDSDSAIESLTPTQVKKAIAERGDFLDRIFEEAGPDIDPTAVKSHDFKDGNDFSVYVGKLNTELTKLGKRRDKIDELEDARENARRESERGRKSVRDLSGALPGASGDAGSRAAAVKSIAQILEENESYKAFRERGGGTAVIELNEAEAKTLMTLTTINNVATRAPGIKSSAQEERTVADLVLQGTTDNNTLTYMEETTFTNNAAETSEGSAKPESALAFTERTDNVRKIATWIPATSELLADVAGIRSYIEGRLQFMIKRREELQILVGDGTAPNISGITDRSGIQTQAKGTDPTPDAVYKAMTKVRATGFAEPTAFVVHPNDWQDIRLLRTSDGVYIWGNPSEAGVERIWGLEVRQTTAMTENTGLVGAFTPFAQIFRREGITITVSTEHSTYFTENKVAILAEERLAFAVYRPAAFATVTGI